MTNWGYYKKQLLRDPKVKAEYDKLQPKYVTISGLIELRSKGDSRKALAEKLRTKWSRFLEIESGSANPSIGFLQKLAEALGKKLVIQFK